MPCASHASLRAVTDTYFTEKENEKQRAYAMRSRSHARSHLQNWDWNCLTQGTIFICLISSSGCPYSVQLLEKGVLAVKETRCWADSGPREHGCSGPQVLERKYAHLHVICIQLLKISPDSPSLKNCIVSVLNGTFPRAHHPQSPYCGVMSPCHPSEGGNSPLGVTVDREPPLSQGAKSSHGPPG